MPTITVSQSTYNELVTVFAGQPHSDPVDTPTVVIPPVVVVPVGNGRKLLSLDVDVQGISSNIGGFGRNDVLAIHFKTGPRRVGSGRIVLTEFQNGGTSMRHGVISKSPFDFDNVVAGPQEGVGISFYFTIGNPMLYFASLEADTDYYLNVKNINPPDGIEVFDIQSFFHLPSA